VKGGSMGWDILILNVPNHNQTVPDLTDTPVVPLGTRTEVIRAIQSAFPESDVSDPSWIVVDDKNYSLQISVYQGDPVEAVMINIHGDTGALDALRLLCEATGWRAFDSVEGNWVNFEAINA
jgi:hypothetical protein